MAKKGNPTKQKRLSVAPVRHLKRKGDVWTIRQNPGGFTRKTSVPLGFVVRDMLGLAQTLREAKQIIVKGMVHVDATARADYRFPVGIFDLVSIPSMKKQYRLVLDAKGRLIAPEVNTDMAGAKPLKVVRKTRTKGNTIIVQTQDGYTYKNVDKAVKVDDSVMISVKDTNEVSQHLKLDKGSHVFIVGGTHVGEVAKVAEVVPGTMKRDKLVSLVEGDEKFQTNVRNVMVVDEKTAKWIKSTRTGGVSA